MRVNMNVNGESQEIIGEGLMGILGVGLTQVTLMHKQNPTKALARDIAAYKYLIDSKDNKLVWQYQNKRKSMRASKRPAKVAEVLDAMALDWEVT